MFSLRNVIKSVGSPVISNRQDLRDYVIATTLVCLTIALCADIVNQLIFSESWMAAIRNWIITSTLVAVIAIPVSLSIGRTHLELRETQQTVIHQLAALEKAQQATEAAHKLAQSLARHDVLTGLPNRRVFNEELDKAMIRGTG